MDIWRKWRNPRQKPPFGARIDWSDPITEGLVYCQLFNAFGLSGFSDASMFSHKCELHGPCWVGAAVMFDGSDDWAETQHHNVLSLGGEAPFTIEVLLVISEGISQSRVLAKEDRTNTRVRYYVTARADKTDYFELATLASGTWYVANSSDYKISFGNIQHITVTYDVESVTWFVDGKKDTVTSFSASYFPPDSSRPLWIGYDPYYGNYLGGKIFHVRLWNGRCLSPSEIERLHYEPYSFFLIPAARIFDLAPASGGQTYFYEGNIPLSLLPSHAKEVRYYPPLGGAPIVLAPQGQVKASYQKEGSQQISLTPQADSKATYVKDGSVLMQIALAAEKQARYFAAGEIPINLQIQDEKKALYEKSGALSFSLLPFSRVQAMYAKEGNVSFSLALESDIACTFRVEGSVGFILLPQGSWTYVPATGGAVYTYEGNIPIALAPEADVKALYKKQGGLFLSLSPTSSWQAKYRHVGELLLSLVPAGEKQASFLIEGEIQLHLVPEGVAVVIKPSGQEELFVVGIIEEDDLRAVFDGAVHGEIWPRK